MHSRFAAVLLGLGLIDLAYVNFALGPDIFPSASAREAPEPEAAELSARPAEAPRAPQADDAPEVSAREAENTREAQRPVEPESAREAERPVEPESAGEDGSGERPGDDLIINFPKTNTAELPEDVLEMLDAVARRLFSHPELLVTVTGHADARGTREHNLDLGGRRARTVAAALTRAGVKPGQLQVRSRGEDEPRAVGITEETWAQNRRVEIAIHTRRSPTP